MQSTQFLPLPLFEKKLNVFQDADEPNFRVKRQYWPAPGQTRGGGCSGRFCRNAEVLTEDITAKVRKY